MAYSKASTGIKIAQPILDMTELAEIFYDFDLMGLLDRNENTLSQETGM